MKPYSKKRLFFGFIRKIYPFNHLMKIWQRYRNQTWKKEFDFFYTRIFEHVESGSLRVKVSEFQGTFEIDVRSDLLYRIIRKRHYEPELAQLALSLIDPQKDVVDIGANIGFYTVLAAKNISPPHKVLSIEPTPQAFAYLRRNVSQNQLTESVLLYQGVITDKPGIFQMKVIPGKEEYSSISSSLMHADVQGLEAQAIEVPGETLDHLITQYDLSPAFIKIDAEGAEFLVLNGAIHTLKKYHPIILSEISDELLAGFGCTSADIIRLLESSGYQVVNAETGESVSAPFSGEILATIAPIN